MVLTKRPSCQNICLLSSAPKPNKSYIQGVPKNVLSELLVNPLLSEQLAGQSPVTRPGIDLRLLIDGNSESAFFGTPCRCLVHLNVMHTLCNLVLPPGEDSSAGVVEEGGRGLPKSPNIFLSGVSISRSPSEQGNSRYNQRQN